MLHRVVSGGLRRSRWADEGSSQGGDGAKPGYREGDLGATDDADLSIRRRSVRPLTSTG